MNKFGIFNSYNKPSQNYGGSTYSQSTNALSPNQDNTLDITIGYNFYITQINTNHLSRIRGYLDTDTRISDISRSLNNNINFPNKCIFDFKIKDTLVFPYPLFFVNAENPQNKKLFITITNLENTLKVINFDISCIEISKKEWDSLDNVNNPYFLTQNDSKILLRGDIDLKTSSESLQNYLIFSLSDNSTFNSQNLHSFTPIEALINYQTLTYSLVTKSKGTSPTKSAYILFSEIKSKSYNIYSSNYNLNFFKTSSIDYNHVNKSVFTLINCESKNKYLHTTDILTPLDLLKNSFSSSLFTKKVRLSVDKSNIYEVEDSITLPIIINSYFSEIFDYLSDLKDLAVTDTLGNLQPYQIQNFDLINKLVIINVNVNLDPSSNLELILCLNNTSSLSFEVPIVGFAWTHYFPLATDTKDLIKSIEPTGTFSKTSDAERGDYIEFNGSSEYLDLQIDKEYFREFNEYTICMWVKPNSLNNTSSNHNISNCLLAQSSQSVNDILEIGIDRNSKILEVYQDTTGRDTNQEIPTSNLINVNTWAFIAVGYSSQEGVLKVNVDGEINETNNWNTAFDDSGANITLASNENTFIYYHGGIQQLVLSNKLISTNLFNNLHQLIGDPINFFNFTGVENN